MGVGLLDEVVAHAPRDLPARSFVVLLVLAKLARDSTRQTFPGMAALSEKCRMPERSVRRALADLAARGVELRVPIGRNHDGTPRFAGPGHRTVYRIPDLTWRSPATSARRSPAAASGGQIGEIRRSDPDDLAVTRDRPDPHELIMTSSRAHAREIDPDTTAAVVSALHERTGRTVDNTHAAQVAHQLLNAAHGTVAKPAAYVAAAISRDCQPDRFLPTPTPPRYTGPDPSRLDASPADPETRAMCRAAVAQMGGLHASS